MYIPWGDGSTLLSPDRHCDFNLQAKGRVSQRDYLEDQTDVLEESAEAV